MNWTRAAILALAAASLGLAAPTGLANPYGVERQSYSVRIGGLRAGNFLLSANVAENRYAATGEVSTGGLVGVFVDFYFGGAVNGRMSGNGDLQPLQYKGTRISRGKEHTVTMTYAGRAPAELTIDPPRKSRKYTLNPRQQRDTLDPVSATYMFLADRPEGQACDRTVQVYDGSRRSQVSVGPRRKNGSGYVCNGVYSRVAGYPPKMLREKVDFPFKITYEVVDGMMRVTRVDLDSNFGQAVAIRR